MSLRRRNIKARVERRKLWEAQSAEFKAFFDQAMSAIDKYEAMQKDGIEFTRDEFLRDAFGPLQPSDSAHDG